ncbi:unnamed protein product, partial [Amoebophrya sp. A25]|eukprot:GSA25T00011900001.1
MPEYVSEHLNAPQQGGNEAHDFARKISALASDQGNKQARTRARLVLTLGHVSSLLSIKTKCSSILYKDKPVGLSLDGVRSGGRTIKQVRVRGNWYSGDLLTTITLPPLLLPEYSDADLDKILQEDNFLERREAEKKTQLRKSGEVAAVRERVSWMLSRWDLGIERPLHSISDKGSEERLFWVWLMHNGALVHHSFDQPHVESRDCARLAEDILPADFGRFTKVRSTHDGVFAVRWGRFINTLLKRDDATVLDMMADDKKRFEA